MGEAFLVGGNSGMSNAGAVKSVQRGVIKLIDDIDEYDITLNTININKSFVILNGSSRSHQSSTNSVAVLPRIINLSESSLTIYINTVIATDIIKSYGVSWQVVEFY